MKLFGFEITRKKEVNNQVASVFVPSYLGGRETVHPSNFSSLLNAYKSWVYVCAGRNSTNVAQSSLRLYVTKDDMGQESLHRTKRISEPEEIYLRSLGNISNLACVKTGKIIEEILEHPFLELMRNVNPFMNGFGLWELSTLHQELTGNCFWYVKKSEALGVPQEIWVIPPDNMVIIPSKEKFIEGYEYRSGTETTFFQCDEIVHFRYSNPNNIFYGKSPLSAVAGAYNAGENMAVYENSLFSNMARPDGVLATDSKLTDAEFIRLQEQWKYAYGGANKTGKTAVLEKGVKYIPISIKPRDLNFLEGRTAVKEEICNAYGQSLGLYDKNSTRANSEQAVRSFLRDAILPRLRRIEEKLNEQLLPMYDSDIFVAFDSPLPEDKEFRLTERDTNLKLGYSSINQERKIDGLKSVSWGNTPYMPLSVSPLGEDPSDADIEQLSNKIATIVRDKINAFK